MPSDVLPCPFCGGAGRLVKQHWSGRDYFGVACDGDCLTFFDCRALTEDAAVAAWNVRTPPAKNDADVRSREAASASPATETDHV